MSERAKPQTPPAHLGKGFIYSVDATLSIFVLVFVLFSSSFLLAQSETDSLSQLQVSRLGKDALAVMDRQGVLQSGNETQINESLGRLLPIGMKMHLRIDTYYYDNGSFFFMSQQDFGPSLPGNSTTYGARRDFVNIKNNRQVSNYSVARAFIWQG